MMDKMMLLVEDNPSIGDPHLRLSVHPYWFRATGRQSPSANGG